MKELGQEEAKIDNFDFISFNGLQNDKSVHTKGFAEFFLNFHDILPSIWRKKTEKPYVTTERHC